MHKNYEFLFSLCVVGIADSLILIVALIIRIIEKIKGDRQ